ncbi:BSD domain-containing protein 1-like [Olea europaea var. sylvestris]|uniref:BSD domain-containing protein 1-like n=1 Tax=Olea europaea var. sylvestris TaxID=158386 RepID=UPI000C1D7FE4|nr:BSD domain-containing protein 1-like [Olea europaea var. sylvestris]
MDFFKSVFTEPSSSDSQTSSPVSQNSQPDPPIKSNPWAIGSTLLKNIASKSESLIDNYYKDLQEFSSGLKEETSVIRQAASRAVHDLPARLESGAAIAQESLEAVGQAIDNVGSTFSGIIGKELNFTSHDDFLDAHLDEIDRDSSFSENAKPYNRVDAIIRAIQCDVKTYRENVEESGYNEWKVGFKIEEKKDKIEELFKENGVIKEIHDELVPLKVDEETFWCRYFYREYKVMKVEETRARIVKRAISREEEEELSWDVDSDDDDNEWNEIEKNGKKVKNLPVEDEKDLERDNEDKQGVSGLKTDGGVDEKKDLEERLKCDEKASSDGTHESDFSVVPSRSSSHEEEDLGWDEIEYMGSGDDSKGSGRGSHSPSSNRADLRKRLSAAEEDEDLTWDIEDDDEPAKS